MAGGGQRWKTAIADAMGAPRRFPTAAHRPWKTLRVSHIPTAPTMSPFFLNSKRKDPAVRPTSVQAHPSMRICSGRNRWGHFTWVQSDQTLLKWRRRRSIRGETIQTCQPGSPRRRRKARRPPRLASQHRTREWCVYLLLFLATFAVYSQVRHFDFVNFDDPEYVDRKQPRARRTDVERTGLGIHFLRRRQLVSADVDFSHGGLPVLRAAQRVASPDQRAASRAGHSAAVRRAEADDRSPLAQRVCGFPVRSASPACRVRGLDRGEKGCSVRILLVPDAMVLRALCATARPWAAICLSCSDSVAA